LKSLPDEYEIRAVAAGSRAKEAALDLPEAVVVASAEELFRLSNLDLAVIATPSGLHAGHARMALDAGLHVVMEKPFAATIDEAEALLPIARGKKKILTVFHNRRFDSDFLALKSILKNKELGEVREAEFRWERYRPQVRTRWKEQKGSGSGLLWDLSPHLFDQANILFGPFDWVMADIEAQRKGAEVDDWFHIILGSGKTRVILHCGSLAVYKGFHYRVYGTQGTYLSYGDDSQESLLQQGEAPGCPGWGFMPGSGRLIRPDGSEERRDLSGGDWRDFYRVLATALRGTGNAPVDPEEALRVLALMEAARESSHCGRRIVL